MNRYILFGLILACSFESVAQRGVAGRVAYGKQEVIHIPKATLSFLDFENHYLLSIGVFTGGPPPEEIINIQEKQFGLNQVGLGYGREILAGNSSKLIVGASINFNMGPDYYEVAQYNGGQPIYFSDTDFDISASALSIFQWDRILTSVEYDPFQKEWHFGVGWMFIFQE